jgi:tyrosyl-tRNA synthetase
LLLNFELEATMNINEQVELLMQGTEYGDESLKQAMTEELRQRVTEAEASGRKLPGLLRL